MQPIEVSALRNRAKRRGYTNIVIRKTKAAEPPQNEPRYTVTAIDPLTQSEVSAEWGLFTLPHLLIGRKGK